jgi:hypothetical protein
VKQSVNVSQRAGQVVNVVGHCAAPLRTGSTAVAKTLRA